MEKTSLSIAQRSKIVTHMVKNIRRGIAVKSAVLAAKQCREESKILNWMAVLLTGKDLNVPNKTSSRDNKRMKRIVSRSPCSSIKKVQGLLAAKCSQVIAMTVSPRLQYDFRLLFRKPARKPLLTKSMKDKGLKFAKDHRHWTTEDWSKVLFSDESSV